VPTDEKEIDWDAVVQKNTEAKSAFRWSESVNQHRAEREERHTDHRDKQEQETRGNRVSSSEQSNAEWGGILFFALVVLGFVLFIKYYIIPIIGQ